jgi:hypothetical protein
MLVSIHRRGKVESSWKVREDKFHKLGHFCCPTRRNLGVNISRYQIDLSTVHAVNLYYIFRNLTQQVESEINIDRFEQHSGMAFT